MLDGKRVTASVYFAHLHFTQFQFFLIGYAPTILTILFLVLAIFYRKVRILKYICIFFFALTQFLTGLGYTRFAFTNPTHTIYHTQSYKVNAIDTGILAGLLAGGIILLFTVFVLALKSRVKSLESLHKKAFYPGFFLFIAILIEWIFAMTPFLDIISGTPLGV
ncbi:hypothetical protein FACS1894125_3200 [Actinomycetota bacterium]|nr:hypothetical protein FACS1894125_3200 [Actinomycetota bacterium]